MPKLKFYLKIFLMLFPILLIARFLVDRFLLNFDENLVDSFIGSFFSGALFTSILVILHFREFRKNGLKEFTDENLAIKQERVVGSHLNQEDLIVKLKQDSYFKKFKLNLQEEAITIKTFSSDMSHGEIVKIIPIGLVDSLYQYRITSAPKNRINLLDGGANYFNVKKLSELL